MAALERTYLVFRLVDEDIKLLRSVATRVGTMHRAMEALIPVIPELGLEPTATPERHPVRVPIPKKLHDALKAENKRTGIPMIDILLQAARKYEADASGQ